MIFMISSHVKTIYSFLPLTKRLFYRVHKEK